MGRFNFLGKLVYTLECLKIGRPYLCAHRLVINHQAQQAPSPLKRAIKGGLPPFVLSARRFIVGRADKAKCQPIMNHPDEITGMAGQ